MTRTCKRESKAASSGRNDFGGDVRLFAQYGMHDEIGGVRFDGARSSWGANYMRKVHTYSLCGDRGKERRSSVVECASEYSDTT